MPDPIADLDDRAERVARGAAWMDKAEPGWIDVIDPDRLKMQSRCDCVLGQLKSGWSGTLLGLFPDRFRVNSERLACIGFIVSHGFEKSIRGENYAQLTAAWRDLILARRAANLSPAAP